MRVGRLTAGLFAGRAARGAPAHRAAQRGDVWESVQGTPPTAGAQVDAGPLPGVHARPVGAAEHAGAARRRARRAAAGTTVLAVPAPDGALPALRGLRDARSWSRAWRPSTRRSRPTRARASTTRRPRSSPTRARSASTRRCARASGALVRRSVLQARRRASTSATSRATRTTTRRASFVERDPVGESKAADVSGRRRARPGGPAAHLPARAGHRPDATRPTSAAANVTAAKVTLMNRVNQIYEDRDRDPAGPDRRHRQAQPQHGRAGDRRQRPVRRGAVLHGHAAPVQRGMLDRNRIVIGQIIGAGNYDVGHIALGQLGRRRRQPRRRRRQQQGAGLHRPRRRRSATTSPSTTWPTRWATSSTATTPSTARSANCRRQPQRRARRSSRARARRSWPTPASAARTTCSRTATRTGSRRATRRSLSLVTGTRAPHVNEVQNVSLRDFDGTDSFTLSFDGKTVGPFVARRQLHGRRHPGRAAGRQRGPDRRA